MDEVINKKVHTPSSRYISSGHFRLQKSTFSVYLNTWTRTRRKWSLQSSFWQQVKPFYILLRNNTKNSPYFSLVLATATAAPGAGDLSQQQVTREGDLSEAIKTDLSSASTRLRSSVNERMTEFRSKGETAKADALKKLNDELVAFETRVAALNPQTETGKLIKGRLQERLTALETTFSEQYAKKDSKTV